MWHSRFLQDSAAVSSEISVDFGIELSAKTGKVIDVLALDLRTLGERDSYRDLPADTVTRYKRTLGSGHPESVSAAARERAVCDIEPPPV